jgi:hypothetical protein
VPDEDDDELLLLAAASTFCAGTIGDGAEQAMSASGPRIKKDCLTARLHV